MNYEIVGNDIVVTISNGKTTIISIEDKTLLDDFPTWAEYGKYVSLSRTVNTDYGYLPQRIYLHRAIMINVFGLSKMRSWQVDHKDRDKFNNKRSNLRLASIWENGANVVRKTRSNTGYRGVHKTTRNLKDKFIAHIGSGGIKKRKNLGHYNTAEEAAMAYDKEAKLRWGEFACLNFPDHA